MSILERVVHMVLFEIFAIITFIPIAMFATGQGASTLAGLSILLSVIAMTWNFTYNWGYDALLGDDRMARGFRTRILHGLGFEAGMVILSFPVMMYILQENFFTILMMDIGAVIFFLLYAIVFNWCYDVIRFRMRPSTTKATRFSAE